MSSSIVAFRGEAQLDGVMGLPVPNGRALPLGPTPEGGEGERLVITTARHSVPLDTLASAPLSGRLLSLTIEWPIR